MSADASSRFPGISNYARRSNRETYVTSGVPALVLGGGTGHFPVDRCCGAALADLLGGIAGPLPGGHFTTGSDCADKLLRHYANFLRLPIWTREAAVLVLAVPTPAELLLSSVHHPQPTTQLGSASVSSRANSPVSLPVRRQPPCCTDATAPGDSV